MTHIRIETLNTFFQRIGEQLSTSEQLQLLGGSSLALLGYERPTYDVDFVGAESETTPLRTVMKEIARQMRLEIEPVPIEEFIPLPPKGETRHIMIGQFGRLTVSVLDPYAMGLSKLERGFDSDIDDILFLLKHNHITLPQLNQEIERAVEQAYEFNLDVPQIRAALTVVKERWIQGKRCLRLLMTSNISTLSL